MHIKELIGRSTKRSDVLTIKEFRTRETVRGVVAEQAIKLQDLIIQINEILTPELDTSRGVTRDKDKTKIITTRVQPKHEYFMYPFRIIEKEFHSEPHLEQLNGGAQATWSLRFEGKLDENEEEDFFPFFEFTRLTSGECIVRHSTQSGEDCEFDSRQLTDTQELEEKFKAGYVILSDLGIEPFLLRDLLPGDDLV